MCLVGIDPVLTLEGRIPATRKILADNALGLDDIDVVEINEAFASVVLAWQRALDADMTNVNPNGGAIALGHPLGATGSLLITKAVHELVQGGRREPDQRVGCAVGAQGHSVQRPVARLLSEQDD